MTHREVKSFCRICSGGCGVRLLLDDNDRLLDIKPDRDHPMSRGYACYKGLNAVDIYQDSSRITHTLKRTTTGDFVRIGIEDALDEVAEKFLRIRAEFGTEAIATFLGTAGYQTFTARPFLEAFSTALGTPANFTNGTIDQSAKWIAAQRLGFWAAGKPALDDCDVALLVGTNPLVSRFTLGLFGPDPTRELKRSKARGLRLIVIDPRRTETSRYADIHLQPYPGQDAVIAAGLLRIILAANWQDQSFCTTYIEDGHLARLRAEVEPFTPDVVAKRAGIGADQLLAAAEMFASARNGAMYSATGPSMSPRSNLAEHLLEVINVVCGRYRRAGASVNAITPWMPPTPMVAQVIPPSRPWEAMPQGRIRGARSIMGQMFTANLPDEILTPGKGQIRALINQGGNPVSAIPDMQKVTRAFRDLELLVSIEPMRTTTAQLSHYIFAPRLQYEREDLPATIAGYPLFPVPWAQYQPAIVRPPDGAELIDDWYFYWSVAQRMGLELMYNGVALDMHTPPTNDQLMAMGTRGSLVPLDDIKRYPGGKVYDLQQQVLPAQDDGRGKFAPMPDDIAAELAEVAAEPQGTDPMVSQGLRFNFRLMARRSQDMMNTMGLHSPRIRARNPYNPLHMNPADLSALNIASGERVEVVSEHGRLTAVAEPDATLRSGVVTLSHGWGWLPDETAQDEMFGASINLLISSERHLEPINSMPRMSAIPVNIRPLAVG